MKFELELNFRITAHSIKDSFMVLHLFILHQYM